MLLNINDDFFKGIYKEVWKALIPNGLTEAEVSFIIDVCDLQKGDCVLDIMCGYGRHVLELGRRGIGTTAVDNLEGYIEEIKLKAGKEDLPVQPVLSGALEVSLSGLYDAAICMGNSFAFFDKEGVVSLLKKITAHLKPKGIIILNSWMIAEIVLRHFKQKEWYYVNGYKYLLDYSFHFHPGRIESEQTIITQDGAIETIRGIDYVYSLNELDAMFKEAGLITKELYSTPAKKKFSIGDGKIYIVAQKQ